MKSRERIGLYGSGDVPRSRRLWSRTAGPESLGLKDLRQIPPITRGRPGVLRRSAIAVSAFLAIVAVVVIVSAFALTPTVSRLPAEKLAPPGTPFPCVGYTLDGSLARIGGVQVTITNLNLSLSGTAVSDSTPEGLGLYFFDLSSLGVATDSGNLIRIEATSTLFSGLNVTAVPTPMGGFMWLNVTLNATIPEFGDVVIPMAGMVGVFLIVALVARTRDD